MAHELHAALKAINVASQDRKPVIYLLLCDLCTLTILYIIYVAQNKSSSLSVAQENQTIGHPCFKAKMVGCNVPIVE